MHEKAPRLLVQHVAVNRGHLNAIGTQRLKNGIYFITRQHEVTRDGRPTLTARLKVDGNGHAQGPTGAGNMSFSYCQSAEPVARGRLCVPACLNPELGNHPGRLLLLSSPMV
jgi:hypothetical protein